MFVSICPAVYFFLWMTAKKFFCKFVFYLQLLSTFHDLQKLCEIFLLAYEFKKSDWFVLLYLEITTTSMNQWTQINVHDQL